MTSVSKTAFHRIPTLGCFQLTREVRAVHARALKRQFHEVCDAWPGFSSLRLRLVCNIL